MFLSARIFEAGVIFKEYYLCCIHSLVTKDDKVIFFRNERHSFGCLIIWCFNRNGFLQRYHSSQGLHKLKFAHVQHHGKLF